MVNVLSPEQIFLLKSKMHEAMAIKKSVAGVCMLIEDTERAWLCPSSSEALWCADTCTVAVTISVCARPPLFACLSVGCVMRPLPVTSASVKVRLGSQVYLWGE